MKDKSQDYGAFIMAWSLLISIVRAIMETPLKNVSECELRAVIRFLTAKNETAVNIHKQLISVYGDSAYSYVTVTKWRNCFLSGRNRVHDEERSGRPSAVKEDKNIVAVRTVLEKERRLTIDEILDRLPPDVELGRTTVFKILTEELKFSKVCARWVPRLLTPVHKQRRLDAAQYLFQLHAEEDNLLSRIVTGDETWVHHSTPETKQQSMVWKTTDEEAPKKAKVILSAGKIMATVFWDARGILLIEFLGKGETINAERYCETLTKLRAAIKRKRPGLLTRNPLLLHDNARPHAAGVTQDLLTSFTWDVFPHPPYSPDLAPSDYHLFPALKNALGGKKFVNDAQVEAEVRKWFQEQSTQFYADGIQKLLSRYQKCVQREGDYVEK